MRALALPAELQDPVISLPCRVPQPTAAPTFYSDEEPILFAQIPACAHRFDFECSATTRPDAFSLREATCRSARARSAVSTIE